MSQRLCLSSKKKQQREKSPANTQCKMYLTTTFGPKHNYSGERHRTMNMDSNRNSSFTRASILFEPGGSRMNWRWAI